MLATGQGTGLCGRQGRWPRGHSQNAPVRPREGGSLPISPREVSLGLEPPPWPAGARRAYDGGKALPSHPPQLVPSHGPWKGLRKSRQRKSRVICDSSVSAQMHRFQVPLCNKSPRDRSSSSDRFIPGVDSASRNPGRAATGVAFLSHAVLGLSWKDT